MPYLLSLPFVGSVLLSGPLQVNHIRAMLLKRLGGRTAYRVKAWTVAMGTLAKTGGGTEAKGEGNGAGIGIGNGERLQGWRTKED